MKTKINVYADEATDFRNKEMPKIGSNHTCLAVITIDLVFKKDENYYLQMYLKDCKYKEKKLLDILLMA